MIKNLRRKMAVSILVMLSILTAVPVIASIQISNYNNSNTVNYQDNKVDENDIAYENITIADYDAVAWNLLNLHYMWFKITPYANLGLYLQPHLADGKDVDVWDAGSTYSQWTFEPHEDADGDYFYIKNVNTGKYLWFDVLQNGAKVNVETTNPGWNNRWQLVTNQTTFTFSIRPYADTRYCLDIGGRDVSNPEMGDYVQIWEYLGGQNQEWCIDPNAREDYNNFFSYGVGNKPHGLQAFNEGTEGSLYGMAKHTIDFHNYKSSFGFNNNIWMNYNLFNPGANANAKVGNIKVFREVNENYKFPLKIDNDGYRYFDSKQMYVEKNDEEKKFELYNGNYDLICHFCQKEWNIPIRTKNGMFAPYNTPANINFQYGFAMTMQLEFYMSSDGKVHIFDEDGHETTQSMIFEFSGDDDMWIYIDKDLCLDVGGTHPAKPGNINFDKSVNGGKCVAKTFEGDGSIGWQKEFDLSTGTHTLTMFYIERAQDEANLKIRYNLISKNNLEIDPNGGTYKGSSDIYEAGNYLSNEKVPLAKPVRTGYTFTGWKIEGSGRISSDNKKYFMGVNDTTLVAQWTPNAYNLKFDYNKPDGAHADVADNSVTSKKVYYKTAVGELPQPTLKGYTFKGWQDADGNTYDSDTVYDTLGDTTIYAQWEKQNYTITFDYNCSKTDKITGNSVKTKSAVYGEAVGELPKPSIEGKIFNGWYRETSTGYKHYYTNTIYDVDGDITLKAYWSTKTCTVYYYGNGGTADGTYDYADMLDYDYGYNSYVEIHENPFSYDGDGDYIFAGWSLTADGEVKYQPGEYVTLTDDLYLYAVWSKETSENAKYTIKHYKMDVNGNYPDSPDDTETFTGLIGSSVIPAVKDYGEGFEKPAEQTVTIKADGSTVVEYKYARKQYYLNLNGYLKQWESQSNKGYLSELVETVKNLKGTDSRYTFATAVIKINGTVHANGNGVTDFYEKVYYGSTYEVVTTAKAGYTIIDNTGKLTGTVDKANDTDNTVTPRLSINSYIIKFNANKPAKATGSVTGTTSDQSIYYNRERKLNKNGYALNGWQFNGWNTQPDGTGVTYNDEQAVKNLSAKDGDNINLYAQWTPSGYTVATTKTTGISSTSGDGTYHDGDKVLINAVVQAGYNFDGWYLDNSKVTGDTSYSFTMTPGNKTFTAKATAKQFNITLIARYEQPDGSFKEETVIDNKLYDFGSTVSWSRAEDKEYREASISWIVTGNDIKYVDVKRRTYNQTLTVQYENADGSFTNPETVINAEPYRYGSIVSWSRAQDAVYQKAEISWTVTGDAKENVKVYRNKYTITVNGDSHIESTSGSGTYRYGTKITISATPKYGYRFVNWNNDSGLTVNPMSGTVTHDAAYTAYTTANNYTLTYNKGATNVAANNFTETYPYGKSVNIAVNKFTGRSYNISFDSNGGSSVAAIKGSLEFYKWIDSNKTSWQPSQNYTVERDMTFTAQWKNKTITFSTPSREGYTFTGWYDGNNKIDSLTITPADTAYTKQLTAHWQINQYPVIVEHYIMDTNGNYSIKPDKTVKGVNGQPVYNYHTDILSTACIDKSLIIAGGIEYDSDKTPEKTTVTADSNGTVIRIYYKRIKHTVTFNVAENGGYWKDNTSNTNRTISVYYGNAYSSSSFDNIAVKGFNFDFKGWNTQYDTVDSMKSLNAKMGTGDITYYAIYSKDITTTFIDCQGARTVNVTIWNKDRQGIISVPAIRDYNWKDTTGCKPIGYNSTSDINKDGAISAQVADKSSLTVSDNATYYAVYTAKATLVYDTKEGTLKDSAAQILVDVFCNANDINNVRGAQIKLAYCDRNPVSHDGYNHTYDFANWESSLDGKTYNAGKTFTVTKNMIMTAVWNETITPITYTIHFEKVLGEAVTNVPDDIMAVYDKAVTIPDNIPVRTGFTFTGWALTENASIDIIRPGSKVKNLTTTDGAVVNLYAQWKQRKLIIVKASSTMYNDTIIRRTAGDDEWYNSVGKLGIQDLKNYPDDKCVQVWKIDKNGNITQTK